MLQQVGAGFVPELIQCGRLRLAIVLDSDYTRTITYGQKHRLCITAWSGSVKLQ